MKYVKKNKVLLFIFFQRTLKSSRNNIIGIWDSVWNGCLLFTVYTNLMTWSADDGWKDGTGCIITGKTGLAHTGAVVDNQRCYIIVTHFADLGFEPEKKYINQ